MRRPGRGRRLALALIALATLGATAALVLYRLTHAHPVYVLTTYQTAVVSRHDITDLGQFPGLVDFATTLTLRAPATGTIAALEVAVGAGVGPGQILARLDSPETLLSLRAAEGLLARKRRERERMVLEYELQSGRDARALTEAEAGVRRASETLATRKALRALGGVSRTQLDDAVRELEAAESAREDLAATVAAAPRRHDLDLADLDQDIADALQGVEQARRLVDALALRSPIAAKVVQLAAAPGTPVDTRTAVLTLVDQSAPVVRLELGESRVAKIALGQGADILLGSTRYEGRITAIDARATGGSDTTNPTIAVTVGFVAPPSDLLPGASARVELTLGHRAAALTLPRGPYLTTGGGAWAYVIRGSKAVRTGMEIGMQAATEVEITRGLREGDRVIVSGYQEFLDYEQVDIDPEGDTSG